jgi:hypothetical protein
MKPLSLIHLQKENDLNKILRAQKRSGEHIHILYTSPWDKNCQKILGKLARFYPVSSSGDKREPLYIANSFTMPHSFVIFKTNIVPHLVTLRNNSMHSQDYLPLVYQELGIH